MYLVVWDRTKQAVCVDSDTMFRFQSLFTQEIQDPSLEDV
jgi:hypothetical protein